jgi:hypothetical protein
MKLLLFLLLPLNLVFAKNLLWEVKSGESTVYLTGSIHMAKPDMYPLKDILMEKFDESYNLVLEIHPDSLKGKAMLMLQKMMLTDGSKLKDKLDSATYNSLASQLKDAGIPEFQFNMMKPWGAALTLTQLQLMKSGLDIELGIDKHFFNKAVEKDKMVLALEKVEDQLAVFDSFDENPEAFVKQTLESYDNNMAMLDEMIAAWKKADLEELDKIINASSDKPEFKIINEKLLDERNFKMADKIENYLNTTESYFVVVGAGHLSGKNGLINLMKNKGFTVKRL